MLHKKDCLEKLIVDGKVKRFSIAGKPSKEIQEAFVKGQGFIHIFKKYGIESRMNKFESSLISIYIPTWTENGKGKALLETCLVNFTLKDIIFPHEADKETEVMIMNNAIEEMNKVIENLLDEVYDFYQNSLTPVHFLKVLQIDCGRGDGGKLDFEDMLMLIPDKQVDVAEKIGVNRGTVTDYKAGRITPSLNVLSRLIKAYPLLPWMEYIEGLVDQNDIQ